MTKFVAWFAAMAVGVAAPVPKDGAQTPLYFPTTVGAKWVYRNGEAEVTQVVTAVGEKDGAGVVRVGVVRPDDRVRHLREVTVSAAGLYELEDDGFSDDPGGWALKLAADGGAPWKWDGLVLSAGQPERVDTPAGVYAAVPVRRESPGDAGNPRVVKTCWYAPGVGLVKEVAGGREVVLKSFTPGRP